MNTTPDLLERWGRFAVRRRWYVIAVWLLVAAAVGRQNSIQIRIG